MPDVVARYGNILEGGSDLTALPCSAKGTFSSSVRRHIENYNLPTPTDLMQPMRLGDVTSRFELSSRTEVTRSIVFCASVYNDSSTYEAIEKIGNTLGMLSKEDATIKHVEAPILGAGAGRLEYIPAALSLAKGFRSARSKDATLVIFSYDRNTVAEINRKLNGGWKARLWDATSAYIPIPPLGRIDLKKLFGKR